VSGSKSLGWSDGKPDLTRLTARELWYEGSESDIPAPIIQLNLMNSIMVSQGVLRLEYTGMKSSPGSMKLFVIAKLVLIFF